MKKTTVKKIHWKTRRRSARHEAGHVVVALLFGCTIVKAGVPRRARRVAQPPWVHPLLAGRHASGAKDDPRRVAAKPWGRRAGPTVVTGRSD